ncbi:acyl carrier protein [Aliivibrio sp. S2TY2]|uniref:acyl carrier protein n=1 Tax=unclassified Aliivibrio TaxID=2645654 RepID=UPI0023781DB1|nr:MULTISPECIES: acyl carrier protein [unclassified Aliivibrio]MDD9174927.1 acyl carrier protein [Aliivibrio sp. S3TY1]MDD9192126.1 acyl carrier protein [Aliivibrio sp. S2TY2]
MNIENKVLTIVSEVLEVELNAINLTTTIDDLDSWDSMMTINLMTVICDEYGMMPSFEDFEYFTSVSKIVEFINKNNNL